MDWKTLYCPNKYCTYYGIPFQQGKMVKNGSTYGQPQALCKSCGNFVSAFYEYVATFETKMRPNLNQINLSLEKLRSENKRMVENRQ